MAEESPIKSIYRYKSKADKRQKLVLKYNQSTSDIQREKIHFQPSQANKSEITKESKSEGNINAERELKATDYEYDPLLPKNQLYTLDAELLPNSTTPNQTLPKYKKSKVKLKKQQKREKFTFTGNPDYKVYKSYETKEERNMRHKHKRKRRKKIKKRTVSKRKTNKDSEEAPTVYKELMISGVAIRKGQPYYIIAGITNHVIPRIRNYIINGVVNRGDETIYIISGIMYEKEEEPEIIEPDTCSCMHLYDEYMSKRRLEHKECIDVYVEYSRQMSGSKKSSSKKSLNKKSLMKKSSSTLSKKIRFMNYEFMISADKYEGQKSPLCIVSGVQGRTIFNEFLKSLQSGINLMSQRNCTCVVREVQKEDDGILKLIVAGIATSATNLKIVLKGIKKENDGKTLIICSDTALPKKSQIDKDRMVTFILGGVTPMKIVSPLNEIKFNPTKKDLKSCTDITATYTINGVPLDVNKCEYIIGYVKTLDDGTKTFTVDGIVLNSTNKNNSIDYCCLTEMSRNDCECVTSYKNKSNLKTTNKMNQNVDGTPTYLMTGDAAKTVIGDYINTSVSSIPSRTFIIGGVVPNENGPPSYIISGVAALNSARRAIRYHGIPKNAMIIGGVKRQRDGTSIFIISGIAEGADWEDDEENNVSEENTVCTCLEKFNEYLKTATKIEMKTKRDVKKESSETKLAKPAEVNYFPKYGQMNVLKATLKEMAADGYPIPKLFQCYKLPIFKLWLEFRSRKILTPKMKDDLLIESIEMWKYVQSLQIPKPKLPMTPKQIRTITWYNVKSCRKKINTLIEKIKCDIRQGLVDGTRRFWPTTCAYDLPNPTFKDVFFAYCPWKEPVEPMAVRPWMRHEYKNLK